MTTLYYNVHDFLSFSVSDHSGILRQLISATRPHFANLETVENDRYRAFSVDVGSLIRKPEKGKMIDDNIRVGENYICYCDKRKLARWMVEIENIENSPAARIQTNLAGSIARPLNLIEFLLHYCLLLRGFSMIHAGGVVINKCAILVAGTSGSGKTTITLSLAEQGAQYLGDNYVIISNGIAYSYPTALSIFCYNRIQSVERALSSHQKVSLALRQLFYQLTCGYFKLFQEVDPAKVCGDKIVPYAQIGSICFLEPNTAADRNAMLPRQVPMEEGVKKLRYNMELEWMPFAKVLCSYGYLHPESVLAHFWYHYEVTLRDNLHPNTEFYTLSVPPDYGNDLITLVVDHLAKLAESN